MSRSLFTVSLLFICINAVLGQNWRPIQYERIPLFAGLTDSAIYAAIKTDSVTVNSNNDTMFWNYKVSNPDCLCQYPSFPQLSYDQGGCNFSDTGWLGYPVIQHGNEFIFFNYRGDTLLLKPSAPLGSSWIFARSQGGNYIEAKVQSAYASTILGVSDSVKQITLTAKRSNGTLAAVTWLNNYEILCSRNNGLLKGFFFYYFDAKTDSNAFGLPGCQKIQLGGFQNGPGRKLLTNETIYDFQTGDVFHYKGAVSHPNISYFPLPGPEDLYVIKRTITGVLSTPTKIAYSFLDSMEYRTMVNFNYPSGMGGTFLTSYSNYTGTITKPANKGYILPDVTPLDSFQYGGYLRINTSRYGGVSQLPFAKDRRIMKTMYPFLDTSFNYHHCFFESQRIDNYIEENGLGTIYERVGEGLITGDIYRELVYYRKGNTTGGTPIGFTSVDNLQSFNGIRIYPNPVARMLNLEFEQAKHYKISISDLPGRIALSTTINSDHAHVDVKELSPGIYFVAIQDETGRTFNYKILKR